MSDDLEQIKKTLYDPATGMQVKIAKMEEVQKTQSKTLSQIQESLEVSAVTVSGLLKFQTEEKTRNDIQRESQKSRRVFFYFAIGQGVAIVMFILKSIFIG